MEASSLISVSVNYSKRAYMTAEKLGKYVKGIMHMSSLTLLLL